MLESEDLSFAGYCVYFEGRLPRPGDLTVAFERYMEYQAFRSLPAGRVAQLLEKGSVYIQSVWSPLPWPQFVKAFERHGYAVKGDWTGCSISIPKCIALKLPDAE